MTSCERIFEFHFDDGSDVWLFRRLGRIMHDHYVRSAGLIEPCLLSFKIAFHLPRPAVHDVPEQVVVRLERIIGRHDG
ncbi:hypothetical protein WS62_14330 [Burkholderia sp. ABCPW 14]|nr:hypothetical protein WS62_14330 [Burkholderia sp. ABCPW 14]